MPLLERIGTFFSIVGHLASDPMNLAILFGSVVLGIMFILVWDLIITF